MTPIARLLNFRRRFQFKLFLSFSLLTFLVTILLTIAYVYTDVREELKFRGELLQAQAEQLAYSCRLPLYAENRVMLNELARQVAAAPEIISVIISSEDNRVLADVRRPDRPATTRLIKKSATVHSFSMPGSVDSLLPGGEKKTGSIIGSVQLVRETSDLSGYMARLITMSISTAFLFWLVVALASYQLFRNASRSFNNLIDGIEHLKGGDLSFRIDLPADDEPGRAAAAVNELAESLRDRTEENRRLLLERLDLERQILKTQKLESLGVMAGGVAHDFNNLLQSMLGNMELALRTLDKASEPGRYLLSGMKSAKRAAQLTSSMLTYAGGGLIVKKALDLNALVRENVELLHVAVSATVTIKLRLDDALPVVLANEVQIQQLVMNLVTNAAESIEEPSGSVRISSGTEECDNERLAASLLEEKPDAGRFVFLEISDNGSGMNEVTQSRMFDPFYTTKFTGRGLGMSAVMGIVKTHNGALFLKSAPGNGTTIRVVLPLPDACRQQVVPEQPAPACQDELDVTRAPLTGLALLVDDEKPVLKVCGKMLSLCGLSVITACDGREAVATFREKADDIVIVIMDLTMPNMDGIAAMNDIHAIRPDAKVFISSGFNADELDERLSGITPPVGLIRKPYSLKTLENELKRVLP